jgi:uncharacterized protein (DUF305 family)
MYRHDIPRGRRVAVLLLVTAGLAAGGCTPDEDPVVTVQPGAPGEPGQVIEPGGGQPDQPPTAADVRFVQAMIAHHAQALELTGLVDARTSREDIGLLAERMEISQADEIAVLEGWLEARGEPVTGDHQDHQAGGQLMPGMLTGAQLAELAAAQGGEFDRLFLESMTYHHEGARIMVAELFAAGGGAEAEIFQLATHIDSDQRIEIDRMQRLLADLPGG